MSMKKYVLQGLGEFFDGLIVHCDDEDVIADEFKIERIEQTSELFTTFSVPVNSGLFVHGSCLKPFVTQDREFLTDNPFGVYKAEGKVERDNVTLLWGLYSRALTISVKNLDKTLLSQNVFDKETITKVREFINSTIDNLDYDILNAVFDLKEICDG